MMFIEAILPITQYDYLEPYWTDFVIKIFKIDQGAQSLINFGGHGRVTDQILTLGYENQLSLITLGSISLFLIIYLFKMLAFLGLNSRSEKIAK